MKNFFILFLLLTSFFLPPSDSRAATISKPTNSIGLVGYWPLDKATTNPGYSTTRDMSGYGNNGNIVGMTQSNRVPGMVAEGMSFAGSQYVVATSTLASSTIVSSTAGSYAVWFKDGSGPVVSIRSGSNQIIEIYISGGVYCGWSGVSDTRLFGSLPTAGVWHHLVCAWDSSGTTLYVDGVLSATSGTAPSTWNTVGQGVFIGRERYSPSSYSGNIDDVRVYNRKLSQGEALSLYQSRVGVLATRGGTATSGGVLASSTAPLSRGLVGYWRMDGNDINWGTSKVADVSGNSQVGTLNTITQANTVAGKVGQALTFNGSASYIDVGTTISSNTGSQTVSAWIRPRTTNGGMYVPVGNLNSVGTAANFMFEFNRTAGSRLLSVSVGATFPALTGTIQLQAGRWYHVVYTRQGASGAYRLKIYVNGVLDVSGTTNATPTTGTGTTIGRVGDSSNFYFPGDIDEVRMYDRALSDQEVAALYQLGNAGAAQSNPALGGSGLVGYWTFDGPKTNWETGTIQDSSGQGYTAQMSGMSTITSPVAGKVGQALEFSGGTTAYLTAGDITQLNSASAFTLSGWARQTASNEARVFAGKGDSGTALILTETYSDGNWYVEVRNGGTTYAYLPSYKTYAPAGSWFHWAMVYNGTAATDAGKLKLYINGVEMSLTYAGPIPSTTANLSGKPFTIGYNGYVPTWTWRGAQDDVRVYNRALSTAEIRALYQSTK